MSARITIDPPLALIDAPRTIVLSGFAPHTDVTLTLTSRHADGRTWRSQSTYRSDREGSVDVSRQAPTAGGYGGVDGQAPFWSQDVVSADPADSLAAPAVPAASDPIPILAEARDTQGNTARTLAEQQFAARGVRRQPWSHGDGVGVLYTPATSGPHPAIVVLNGSGGGINEARAALFASHGYAALALGYFGAPGLPDYLSGIPLEYFERALLGLHETLKPAHGFVAISGHSRGGELALLLGSHYPRLVSAVLAYVPSSVVHGVLNAGPPGEGRFAAAWTLQGEPLAHVWASNEARDWTAIDTLPEPRRQAAAFVRAQQDAEAVARARIPVERINGPVLLVSGGDDGYWPSSDYAREVVATLRAAQHAHPVEHLDYPDAGHALQAPTVPTTEIARAHAVSGIVLSGGGTAHANAQANAASWASVHRFLQAAIERHPAQSLHA